VNRTMTLLIAALLLCACATGTRMTPAERLELYRANSGEPIRGFSLTGSIWGWRALGNSAVTIWPRNDRGYLIELVGACPDLQSATSIELTNRTHRVTTSDSVIPRGHALSATRRTPCRIRTIRPINTHVIVEQKADMYEDVELMERDPSIPTDPEEGAIN